MAKKKLIVKTPDYKALTKKLIVKTPDYKALTFIVLNSRNIDLSNIKHKINNKPN